ncbi:MAG: CapA family protein [bacterium]|nr:CapA family protein [bacterium]
MKTAFIVFSGIIVLGVGAVFLFPSVIPEYSSGIQNTEMDPRVGLEDDKEAHTILFVGDIMLDRSVKEQIDAAQDPLYPFLRIADTLRSADLTFANLEGPISSRGTNQGSQYSFRFSPASTISALRFAGIDIVNLANNHILDWGAQALLDTMASLDEAPLGYTGAGRNEQEANLPSIGLVGNTKVAIMGYTTLYPKSLEASATNPGISSFNLPRARDLIQSIKANQMADVVIISMHWGTEYATSSDESQRVIAHALIDSGADLIIGHHPHVVQEVERYESSVIPEYPSGIQNRDMDPGSTGRDDKRVGYIVYSLGNFVFDQDFSSATMNGLMIQANLKDKKIESIERIPIQLTPTFQPYIPGQLGDPALIGSGS